MPSRWSRRSRTFDLTTARFVVISKSGGTPETLVQALAALDAVQGGGPGRAHSRAVPRRHRARDAARPTACALCSRRSAFRMLDHHPGIGGRFSGADQRRPAAGDGARARCAGGARGRPERGRACWPPRPRAICSGASAPRSPSAWPRERGIRAQVMMPYATGWGASPPGSCSCGPRASARTGRARRRSPASGRSISTASCSFSWTGRASI